jgi:hypothetical protein
MGFELRHDTREVLGPMTRSRMLPNTTQEPTNAAAVLAAQRQRRWLDRYMRTRRIKTAICIGLAFTAACVAMTSCGTLVQVVDERQAAVSAAQVLIIYPSFNGPSTATDSDGYARLSDCWFHLPAFSMEPAWVVISTPTGTWHFDYPPPSILRLVPACK